MSTQRGLIRAKRLSRTQKIQKIKKIFGPRRWNVSIKDDWGFLAPQSIVEAEVFRLDERYAALDRIKSRRSKPTDGAIRQLVGALRKANGSELGIPEDWRLLLGLDQMIYMLEQHTRSSRKPKRDAYEKRAAAASAMHLCKTFQIKPTTTRKTGAGTKPSIFCQLAAVLYGDEDTDMHHYCREAKK